MGEENDIQAGWYSYDAVSTSRVVSLEKGGNLLPTWVSRWRKVPFCPLSRVQQGGSGIQYSYGAVNSSDDPPTSQPLCDPV